MTNKIYVVRYEDITLDRACDLLAKSSDGYFDGDARCLVVVSPV